MSADPLLRVAIGTAALLLTAGVHADTFAGADLKNGRVLYETHRCASCHAEKTGLAESAFYSRADRKVKTLFDLRRQVSLCSSQLNLQLFPDDERDLSAHLNATFYKLSK